MSKLICRDYIFLLTSGQLEDASVPLRLRAATHRLMCRHCRAFSANDAQLDQIMAQHKARLEALQPDASRQPQDE